MDNIALLKKHFRERIIELERVYRDIKKNSPRGKVRLKLIEGTLKLNADLYRYLIKKRY